jgi:ABC-type Fe2+-enterobactin transport system substrate-binding protein
MQNVSLLVTSLFVDAPMVLSVILKSNAYQSDANQTMNAWTKKLAKKEHVYLLVC